MFQNKVENILVGGKRIYDTAVNNHSVIKTRQKRTSQMCA